MFIFPVSLHLYYDTIILEQLGYVGDLYQTYINQAAGGRGINYYSTLLVEAFTITRKYVSIPIFLFLLVTKVLVKVYE